MLVELRRCQALSKYHESSRRSGDRRCLQLYENSSEGRETHTSKAATHDRLRKIFSTLITDKDLSRLKKKKCSQPGTVLQGLEV